MFATLEESISHRDKSTLQWSNKGNVTETVQFGFDKLIVWLVDKCLLNHTREGTKTIWRDKSLRLAPRIQFRLISWDKSQADQILVPSTRSFHRKALWTQLESRDYLQRSYPSEYKRDIRIEFIIISIEDTSGSSWLYLINALTNPSSPLHPFAFSF